MNTHRTASQLELKHWDHILDKEEGSERGKKGEREYPSQGLDGLNHCLV